MAVRGQPRLTTIWPPDASQPQRTAWRKVWDRHRATPRFEISAVRPAACQTNGSGVELRYVDYRGSAALPRVPILTWYDNNACGPYRDCKIRKDDLGRWQRRGARLSPLPHTRQDDPRHRLGHEQLPRCRHYARPGGGVGHEMEAGWYRYISLWRLHANGTIRPRFGFSAVSSSCVCNVHHHHVYWRFDFDVRTAGNNVVREFNDPPLVGSSNWHDKNYEIRRDHNPARKRKWRVENKSTGEAYDIIPGASDGVATASPDWPFPRGDVWIVRHNARVDDGVPPPPPCEAGSARLNGEPSGAGVVVGGAFATTRPRGLDRSTSWPGSSWSRVMPAGASHKTCSRVVQVAEPWAVNVCVTRH